MDLFQLDVKSALEPWHQRCKKEWGMSACKFGSWLPQIHGLRQGPQGPGPSTAIPKSGIFGEQIDWCQNGQDLSKRFLVDARAVAPVCQCHPGTVRWHDIDSGW